MQAKIKKTRKRSKSGKSEDEGFESPTSPISDGGSFSPGGDNGIPHSNGNFMLTNGGDIVNGTTAPLAHQVLQAP